MNNRHRLLIPLLALSIISCRRDRTPELANYLQEEKKLRDGISNSAALEDSIAAIQERYGISLDQELSRLSTNPPEWLRLLRSLKHE